MSKQKTALAELITKWEIEKGSYIPNAPIYSSFIEEAKQFLEVEKNQMRRIYNQGNTWASEIGSEEFFDQEYTQSLE